ncbi:MAG TPA: DNA repair protein RecO [Ktedonobacterales bacterium]
MAHPRVYATEALVLRRTDFGEADRVLTLFTPGLGKVRVVAKGVRRTTSRLGGHLDSFIRVKLLLATGRNLDIITQAEAIERIEGLTGELWHAAAAWHCVELVDRFLADNDPHPKVYSLLVASLRRLSEGATHAGEGRGVSQLALRYFELHLLDELGFRPHLTTCVQCETVLRPEVNGYSATLGGVLCPNCSRFADRRLSVNALKLLRLLQSTPWEKLPRVRVSGEIHDEVDDLMRGTLRHHLGHDLHAWAFLHEAAPRS